MLHRLRLCDFRLFADLDLRPDPSVTFIVGGNAQGKTSILEAVCVLLRLQSPRTASPAECTRFGCEAFSVDGQINDNHLQVKFHGRLKHFFINGKPPQSVGEYLGFGKVAWISNADRELISGSASARRKFLDFLGVQSLPGYLGNLRTYERALRSRNALLRDGRPRSEISAFDGPLCAAGDFLLQARRDLVAVLSPLASAAYQGISGGEGLVRLAYQPGVAGRMQQALAAGRAAEERLRSTQTGPHRDELSIDLDSRPSAAFCSEGQQRSLALALKLAQARALESATGHPPVYLIDDVFGELDPARRNNLLTELPTSAQKLITTTSLEWWVQRGIGGRVFEVAGGKAGAVGL
ncbi:MAG: DNA replication/repair protein RecF [Terrimicrobiaceae bacterium]